MDYKNAPNEHTLITKARKELGLTQTQLANILEISMRQLQYYEHGEKPFPRYIMLSIECLLNRRK